MSSIEERLARDIAAVTGGVVMTESDLQEAREVLDVRIDGRRRRNRRLYAAAAAAVVVVAGGVTALALDHGDGKAAGPAGSDDRSPSLSVADEKWLTGEALTQGDLVGVWRVDNGEVALRFTADGLFSYDNTGSLFTDFADQTASGAYTVDGSVITLVTSTSKKTGCANAQVRLHASMPEPGKARVVLDPDDTSDCSPVGNGQQALEQILPTMPDYASMASDAAATEIGWGPLTDATRLSGLYFDSENHLLELQQDMSAKNTARGRYYVVVAGNEVVDQGTWEGGRRVLTLTSAAESADCGAGDELVLGDLLIDSVSDGLRGTVTKNTCGVAWPAGAWIHVPDSLDH
jgi:hypothetical protein